MNHPGVRTVVTYSLIGTTIAAGLLGSPDNENLAVVRKLGEYAVVFFFGAAAARTQNPPSGGAAA